MSSMTSIIQYVQQLWTATFSSPPSMTSRVRLDELPECKFPLGNERSDTFTLPDGRKLGYAQYGSPTGKPILFLHGLPGSRMEGMYLHDLGLQLGARIISTDRPGQGWSSPQPNRTLLGFTEDLKCLTDHLKLKQYAVIGVSGGGPSALACAFAMPRDKLKCVTLVCGMGPPDIGMSGAGLAHRLGFPYGWRYAPLWMLRLFFRSDPIFHVELTDQQRLDLLLQPSKIAAIKDEKDLKIYQDVDVLRAMLRCSRETFAQGFTAMKQDGKITCSDFGFKLQDIKPTFPVQLWYGKNDTFVPPIHGTTIAARIGEGAHLQMLDDTHTSIFLNNRKRFLEEMLKTME